MPFSRRDAEFEMWTDGEARGARVKTRKRNVNSQYGFTTEQHKEQCNGADHKKKYVSLRFKET